MPLDNAQKAQACGEALLKVTEQMKAFTRSYPGHNMDVTLAWQDGQTVFSSNRLEKIEALYSAHERLQAAANRPSFDAFAPFYQAMRAHPVLGPVMDTEPSTRLRLHYYGDDQCRLDIGFLKSAVYKPPLLTVKAMRIHLAELVDVNKEAPENLTVTDEEGGNVLGTGRIDRATLAALSPFLMRKNVGVYGLWKPLTDMQEARGKTMILHSNDTILSRLEIPTNEEDFARRIKGINTMRHIDPELQCSVPAAGNKEGYPRKGL